MGSGTLVVLWGQGVFLSLTPPRNQPADETYHEDWRCDQNGQEKRDDMEDFAQTVKEWLVGCYLAQTVKNVVEDGEHEKSNNSAEREPQEGLWL